MKNPKIVQMYRVKNGGRWLEKSIESILDICSEIVVYDGKSTDNTIEICNCFKEVVEIQEQVNDKLDEVRDRNALLQMALKRNPDYILAIDSDEVLMPNTSKILLDELTVIYPEANVFDFQFLTMSDEPNRYKYDGASSNMWKSKLFKLKEQPKNLEFFETNYPGNLHGGSIPNNAYGLDVSIRSNAKFLHYTRYDKELRIKKYQYMNKIDPKSEEQDGYRDLIYKKSKSSGPNGWEFDTLSENMYPKNIR